MCPSLCERKCDVVLIEADGPFLLRFPMKAKAIMVMSINALDGIRPFARDIHITWMRKVVGLRRIVMGSTVGERCFSAVIPGFNVGSIGRALVVRL